VYVDFKKFIIKILKKEEIRLWGNTKRALLNLYSPPNSVCVIKSRNRPMWWAVHVADI
jgi:hypothetical protein